MRVLLKYAGKDHMTKLSEKTYKELKAELDKILERFELSVHDDVDTLLEDYEAGQQLIEELQKKLTVAANKIKHQK